MQPFDFEIFRRELAANGVHLWIEDAQLVAWPANKLTASQVATLRANKPFILKCHQQRIVDLLPSSEVCDKWRQQYCTPRHTEANQ